MPYLKNCKKSNLMKGRFPMKQALMKVLASMKMEEENKVLIAITLKTDEQIYRFLKWLKKEVRENEVESRQDEITGQAVEIAKA